ncbi:MAG: hypothetical protein A2340_04205 [Lentisphaerae bacterium RIFOXYB12_FULL_60_10]|nr:MAG: hypothetical protein A2340_04205 [Lentisphaerae bacterium RIFOXYB12_FULL_60_10]
MIKQVPFADTGATVSNFCLGTMMFGDRCDEAEASRIMACALEHGVNFVDTAAVYTGGQTEEILGRILKGLRNRVFLATKVNVPDGTDYPAQIGPSLDASLARLQTDHVDLYLIHWARKNMNPEAMLRALSAVVQAGKCRFVGCSNFPAWLIAHFNGLATRMGVPRLVNNQLPYNLIERGLEVEILPQAVAERIAITCYRPLMAGVLSGKYDPDQPLPSDSRSASDTRIAGWLTDHATGVRKLVALAKDRGVNPAHVAIAWVRNQLGVTAPIIGVSRLAQFEDSLSAFSLTLTSTEQKDLADAFGTAVKEVSQYYGPLRRSYDLLA